MGLWVYACFCVSGEGVTGHGVGESIESVNFNCYPVVGHALLFLASI